MLAALRGRDMASLARLKALVFALSLLPLARLLAAGASDALDGVFGDFVSLGVNPIELITRSTGTWCLVFILITLAVTPVRRLTGWNTLIRLRRMLGLFAFFYGVLHFTTYIWFDQFFDIGEILKDIWKRPFITVGFAAFLLMIPLAITSTNAMVRRLGGKRWAALHRLVYVLGLLGVIHYWWLVKRDLTQPIIYATVLALLLGARIVWRARSKAGAKA